MTHQFSFLETTLIRSSLDSKTDAEIALLLERDIEEISIEIDRITGGQAEKRSFDIQKIREEAFQKQREISEQKLAIQKEKEDRQRRIQEKKKLSAEFKAKKEKEYRERATRMSREEHRQKNRREKDSRQKFKTRELNMSELQSVKIDDKTFVFVKPGTDIEKIKKQYTRNLETDYKIKN
jgi:hypothetical protein